MVINYEKQRSLGYAGLALLRNWLIGDNTTIVTIFKEILLISKTQKDANPSPNKRAIKHDINTGYKIWSKTYDKEQNILIKVEEPLVKSILKKFTPGAALDAACGTGRYSSFLYSLGHNVTGIDISPEMLTLAKKKNKNVNFILGDLNKLPFDNEVFDLVVCGLAIHQVTNIDKVIKEFTRVVRPGGHIVISSVHPWLVALGAHAEFHDKKEGWGYIKDNIYWHSTYINAFDKASLRILECQEPKIKAEEILILQKGSLLNNKTISEAFEGLPVAIVWVLEKPNTNESKKSS